VVIEEVRAGRRTPGVGPLFGLTPLATRRAFRGAITPTHLARSSCLTKVKVVQHYPKNEQSNQGRSRRGAGWSRMSEADTRLAVRTRRSHIHSNSR
jgi:hypothetical protein